MSEETKIEWATHTFNPWIGCTKVSSGCLNCYAENSTPTRVARKNGKELWGKGKARQRTSLSYWKQPLKWNREAICSKCGESWTARGLHPDCDGESGDFHSARVFPSLCDWLDDEVPIEWLADFLKLIHDTPNLNWLLLSKRPENWRTRLFAAIPEFQKREIKNYTWIEDWLNGGRPPANVWPGASVENQKCADERIPELLKIPAAVRFLSVEPLLGPVVIAQQGWIGAHKNNYGGYQTNYYPARFEPGQPIEFNRIGWVIIGGESGPGARPCNVEWIRDIVRQCQAAGVPCFVKQLGSYCTTDEATPDAWPIGTELESTPCIPYSAVLLKHPKGGDPSEWPEDLRVREFPLSHRGENAASTTQ